MVLLQTVIAFIVALGILIIVHELGHYWAAKLCNVKVLRFSIGMGKVIFSRRFGKDRTEWALSALPFGGYVKMLDAREQDVRNLSVEDFKREFTRQSVWKRIIIVAAGPIANFLLAIIVFTGLYYYGASEPSTRVRNVSRDTVAYQAGLRGGELITAINEQKIFIWSELHWKLLQLAIGGSSAKLDVQPSGVGEFSKKIIMLPLEGLSAADLEGDFLKKLGLELGRPKPILGKIDFNGPAGQGGLKEGDLILNADGKFVSDGLEFIELIHASPGKPLALDVLRNQRNFSVTITPEPYRAKDGQSIGRIMAEVHMAPEMTIVRFSLLNALFKATERTWDTSVLTLKMLGKMIIGEISWKNVTGPITIADYAGQTARIGIISYLTFIALISISLAVMNLLPIPVLDGGLLLYYSLEVLTGRPISARFGEIAQRTGVGILMALMAIAVFNDIIRLMS